MSSGSRAIASTYIRAARRMRVPGGARELGMGRLAARLASRPGSEDLRQKQLCALMLRICEDFARVAGLAADAAGHSRSGISGIRRASLTVRKLHAEGIEGERPHPGRALAVSWKVC